MSLRIVAGALRRRPIVTPPGLDTRPTSDRARQAVFNILEHAPWSDGIGGSRVIDLFAGSGAMGLEALSRGAAACTFVENAEPACAAIRVNVDGLGVEPRTRLMKRDAAKLGELPAVEQPFDLAFLDPPYGRALGITALETLRDGGWLNAGAVCVLERGFEEPDLAIEGFELLDERKYGKAKVAFLQLG